MGVFWYVHSESAISAHSSRRPRTLRTTYNITGYSKDHGPSELLARFNATDGKIEFDQTVGQTTFIRSLQQNGVNKKGTVKLMPSDGNAFIEACLDTFCTPDLLCSPAKHSEGPSNDVASPDSGEQHPLMADMLACHSIDEIDILLQERFCAPDSSERSSNPPPSGKSAA